MQDTQDNTLRMNLLSFLCIYARKSVGKIGPLFGQFSLVCVRDDVVASILFFGDLQLSNVLREKYDIFSTRFHAKRWTEKYYFLKKYYF